mgnify:CR=1 FL=1
MIGGQVELAEKQFRDLALPRKSCSTKISRELVVSSAVFSQLVHFAIVNSREQRAITKTAYNHEEITLSPLSLSVFLFSFFFFRRKTTVSNYKAHTGDVEL